jgi:tetratricopeptide (TPR) repeat protein
LSVPPGSKRAERLLAGAIGLVTLCAYLPALRNGYVNWDDGAYVVDNPHLRTFDGALFRWAFLELYEANWTPLAWISHAADQALWGPNPLGHHLTSVLLHAVNSGLVVLLVARAGRLAAGRVAWLDDRGIAVAAAVAGLLFGLHPIHVESAAWISERKDVLCALFYLLGLLTWLSRPAADLARPGSPLAGLRSRGYWLALAFFALALLSKPMAVSLPAVLLILDWHPLGRIRSWRSLLVAIAEKVPFLALAVLSSGVTVLAQGRGDALSSTAAVPMSVRALVAARSLLSYLWKLAVPLDLAPLYPFPRSVSALSPGYALPLLAAIAVTVACAALVRRSRAWLALWALYVVPLLPAIGLVQVGTHAMADRFMYLPSIAPFAAAGLGAAWASRRFATDGSGRLVRASLAVAGVLLACGMTWLTVRQIAVWHDSLSLWDHAIRSGAESATAYTNRGLALEQAGARERALADFSAAIAVDPTSPFAYDNRGRLLAAAGHLDLARSDLDRAVELNPRSAIALRQRGLLLWQLREASAAKADLIRACALGDGFACQVVRMMGPAGR